MPQLPAGGQVQKVLWFSSYCDEFPRAIDGKPNCIIHPELILQTHVRPLIIGHCCRQSSAYQINTIWPPIQFPTPRSHIDPESRSFPQKTQTSHFLSLSLPSPSSFIHLLHFHSLFPTHKN